MASTHRDSGRQKSSPLPNSPLPGMAISRRDTIIIAMLVNMALLFVLFATATKRKEREAVAPHQTAEQVVTPVAELPLEESSPKPQARNLPVDEIDEILQQYAMKQEELQTKQQPPKVVAKPVNRSVPEPQKNFVEVKVKKGDSLAKIAKAHKCTVNEIMAFSHLENAKLKIGQVLKVPLVAASVQKEKAVAVQEPEYYVVKNGDNPWKIAKQFHLKFEDLLKLNNLDEEKARNLKIGQKIRIR